MPFAHLAGLLVLCGVLLAPPGAARTSEDALPGGSQSARALAESWFHQHQGFDSVEAYEAQVGSVRVEFGNARKWVDVVAKLLLDFNKPAVLDDLMLLFLQQRDRSDDLFVYLSPRLFPPTVSRRIRRLHVRRLDLGLPAAARFVQIGDFRPFLPGELRHTRSSDIEIEGEACRVIESRPVDDGRFSFDRLELALSRQTGVALRTRHYRNEQLIREVYVSPKDVAEFDGHWLPVRQQIRVPGQPSLDLTLKNVDVGPPLPDRLFSPRNQIAQKFPAF